MWRQIPTNLLYEAHPLGRIRKVGASKEMKGCRDKRGYRKVKLAGQKSPQLVHRLIATTFLPNPIGLSDVAHLNGRPGDDRSDNLMWMSHQDNQKMMVGHGTQSVTCKLTAQEVAEIRARHATGKRGIGKLLAVEYGVSKQQITKIVKRQRWLRDW